MSFFSGSFSGSLCSRPLIDCSNLEVKGLIDCGGVAGYVVPCQQLPSTCMFWVGVCVIQSRALVLSPDYVIGHLLVLGFLFNFRECKVFHGHELLGQPGWLTVSYLHSAHWATYVSSIFFSSFLLSLL